MVIVERVPQKDWHTQQLPPCAHEGNVCKEDTKLRFMRFAPLRVGDDEPQEIHYACILHAYEVARRITEGDE